MTAIVGGPGKTAPKLVNDFLRFDPTKADTSASFLTKVTPPVGEGPQLQPDFRSCQHEYTHKTNQIALPPLDSRAHPGGRHRLAVCCKKCRIHADLHVAYHDVATNPCPNSQDPLHHFIRREDVDTTSDQRIQYGWQCSAAKCQAQVTIAYRRPRITEEERKALTDTERLRRAYESMVKDNPAREGLKQVSSTRSEALDAGWGKGGKRVLSSQTDIAEIRSAIQRYLLTLTIGYTRRRAGAVAEICEGLSES